MGHEGSWQIVMGPDGSWRVLKDPDGSWEILKGPEASILVWTLGILNPIPLQKNS